MASQGWAAATSTGEVTRVNRALEGKLAIVTGASRGTPFTFFYCYYSLFTLIFCVHSFPSPAPSGQIDELTRI